ncbi:alpha/beta fold hydrolase [Mycolicibacterium chitae]|nr:alpha/beta fold hydrolase [Mycolicibacterium chitae]MCV7108687.1 alpha/beta fold hydrolase [Mycolicibacterium chitae]
MSAPIMLLHPLGADRHFWDPVCHQLGSRPVEALDLPGHGSAPASAPGSGIAEYSAGVVERIERLGRPVHLVGLSLGGLVAQQLAATRPELLASTVLMGTVAAYPEPMRQMWRERAATARAGGLDTLIEPMVAMWFTEEFADSGDPRIAQARKTFGGTEPEGYARACDLLAEVDLRDQAPSMRPPVFSVCGEDDAPPFREAAEWLAKVTGGDTALWLPGRHACALEHPEQFAALLTGLVAD